MMTHTHFCNTCGKPYQADNCYGICPECIGKHGYYRGRQFCIRCGKKLETAPFTRKKKGTEEIETYYAKEGSITCMVCRVNKRTGGPTTKTCPICGKEFTSKGAQKYCSPECRAQRKTPESTLESHRKAALRWQKSNKDKVNAQSLAKQNPDRLTILYECPCDVNDKHNHHHDYSKPLEVLKLCPTCHRKEHVRLRSLMDEAV